jgi:hypothetical protein
LVAFPEGWQAIPWSPFFAPVRARIALLGDLVLREPHQPRDLAYVARSDPVWG